MTPKVFFSEEKLPVFDIHIESKDIINSYNKAVKKQLPVQPLNSGLSLQQKINLEAYRRQHTKLHTSQPYNQKTARNISLAAC